MGGAVLALVNQIAIMLSIMGIGCMLFRMKIIDRAGAKQMADVVIYLACPAITLRTLMVDFDPGRLFDAGFCMALMTVVTLVSIPLTRLFFKPGEGVARYGAIFANSGFIGVPIVQGVFGEGYVFCLSIGTSVLNFFIWTYGVWLVSGDRDQMSLSRVVRNPNLIAIVVGLACFVFSVHPPRLLDDVLAALGDVNTGLVMLVLGCYLAQSDLRAIVASKKAYLVCLLRLAVIPSVSIAIMSLFPMIPVDVRLTMLIATGAPVASFAAILSEKFGGNYKFGVGLVTLSTLLSLVAMPVQLTIASAVFSL